MIRQIVTTILYTVLLLGLMAVGWSVCYMGHLIGVI